MKNLGRWFADKEIEVVEIEGKAIALSGWNGEIYTECWEALEPNGDTYFKAGEKKYEVKPMYSEADEDGTVEITGYEFY